MCYPDGEFQYECWKHTHLTVDVVPGRGSGFSVEAPEGVRFLIRSRLLTEEELEHFHLKPRDQNKQSMEQACRINTLR
jgi:hypothetical protein